MARLAISGFVACAVLIAGPLTDELSAQQSQFSGLWACEQANYTTRNLAADNFTISWMMELSGGGELVAQGSFYGAVTGYTEPIQGQGTWSRNSDGMQLDFTWLLAGQQVPAKYNLKLAGPQLIDNGRGVAGQYAISCQRPQG